MSRSYNRLLNYNLGVLSNVVCGRLTQLYIDKNQVIGRTNLASKRARRSRNGERGTRYTNKRNS